MISHPHEGAEQRPSKGELTLLNVPLVELEGKLLLVGLDVVLRSRC